jgi:hypothetical protein
MWSRKNSQPIALRDAAHSFRNDATAKKGGELLETNVSLGAQSRTSMVAFRVDRVRRNMSRERSLSARIGAKA